MKILVVHNNYGKPSGEEAVVDYMASIFSTHGHQVVQLRMSTTDYQDSFTGKIYGFAAGLYSYKGVKAMREILKRKKPDVVNVHNLYPFISPSALFECKKAAVPVIMTIHNFRLICPTGLFARNNKPCELCLETGNEWGCIKYNCEQSIFKSIGYAARNAVARMTGAYHKCIDKFVCITEFQRQKLISAGFDAKKILVIPNAINISESKPISVGKYIAFCGRLSKEKGIDMIINAARRHPEIPFRLAGAVRDGDLLRNLPGNVLLAGYLNEKALTEFYHDAAFLVMPSRCYEGFPMSILEAAQYGKPTIGPDHGGFPEIIGRGEKAIGRLFTPGDADSFEEQIINLWNSPADIIKLGTCALKKTKEQYSSELTYQKWQNLFIEVSNK